MTYMSSKTQVAVFLDNELTPIGVFDSPVKFQLNTTKLQDGHHTLKLISKDRQGKERIRFIPFTVKSGPELSVEGIRDNAAVDGELPIMIHAYGKSDQRKFIVEGIESPRSIPAWVWACIIAFFGWAAFYLFTSWSIV
jgi:hypothetical protein